MHFCLEMFLGKRPIQMSWLRRTNAQLRCTRIHTQIRTTNLPHNQPLRKTAAGADCFDNATTRGKNQRMGRGVSEALCKEGRHTFILGNGNDNDLAGWHIAAVRQLSLVSRNSSGWSTSNLTLARQLQRRRLQRRFACMTHRQLF